MKKVNFILPHFPRTAGGGAKVMYEFANHFAKAGWSVTVYHHLQTPHYSYSRSKPLWLRKLRAKILDTSGKPNWMPFQNGIHFKFISEISNELITDACATISTWWSLVKSVHQLSESKGTKINLIQGIETWLGHEDLVMKSYAFPGIRHVAVSPFIYKTVQNFNPSVHYIPNAIDDHKFTNITSIKQRPSRSFLMMYSSAEHKAADLGIKVFVELKKRHPDISVTFFGVEKRPQIPAWIGYHQNPKNLELLYNHSRFFVSTSLTEGWGLPVHEAMACGCVPICSDIPGYEQFISGNSGIFTFAKANPAELIKMLSKVLSLSDEKLKKMSADNQAQVAKFNWENSFKKLMELI